MRSPRRSVSTPRSRCFDTSPTPPSAHRRASPARAPEPPRAVGISLGSLGGLPPSPLFFSELLILLGGLAAGKLVVTLIAAALLGLGFLGLAHALIEGLLGGERGRPLAPWTHGPAWLSG